MTLVSSLFDLLDGMETSSSHPLEARTLEDAKVRYEVASDIHLFGLPSTASDRLDKMRSARNHSIGM